MSSVGRNSSCDHERGCTTHSGVSNAVVWMRMSHEVRTGSHVSDADKWMRMSQEVTGRTAVPYHYRIRKYRGKAKIEVDINFIHLTNSN